MTSIFIFVAGYLTHKYQEPILSYLKDLTDKIKR